MTDASTLLSALQYGDSFFPSGVISFSWGLETLRAGGYVKTAKDVEHFIEGQLRHRWATADRPALTGAHDHASNLEVVADIDGALEALALPREMREGSRRTGRTLLSVHQKLGTPGAEAYRALVTSGRAFAHAPVVQGLVLAGVGLDSETSAAVVAHGTVVALSGAALRMGLLGHLDSQKILIRLRAVIEEIHSAPPSPLSELRAYVPAAEIAMMRHETGDARLFAN
jgi:urease accessory protein